MVVPEQRQFLTERIGTEEHAVKPPCLQPDDLAGRDGRRAEQLGGSGEISRRAHRHAAGQETVDAGVGSVLQIALQLLPGRRKPGATMQVNDMPQIPGCPVVGRIRRPGVAVLHGRFSEN